ncbi:MAG: SusE domain-containing protein [Tannerellaceae bacterium]|jgi:hypothetical protein|nr:SusE domain-containing protein [Tannerellaceae bacterium]
MKKKIVKALGLIAGVMMISSCTEEMEWRDSGVSAPAELFAPTDNQSITLQSSATASVVFDWGSAHSEDGIAPNYEVVFDKAGGDFSTPLYKVTADVGGTYNRATILHKTLNMIAGMAGIESGQSGSLQWTVIAYRGLSSAKATVANAVNLTRFFGFDEIPGSLYLVGDAVEGGSISCVAPANGEYEVFVKLEGGKSFTMNSAADGSGTSFCIDGDRIREGNDGYTVGKTGIYRVSMDFNVASLTLMKEVQSMGMFLCEKNAIPDGWELNYEGNGVWANNIKLDRAVTSWGSDERYRFLMTYVDGSQVVWGAIGTNDSKPGGAPAGDIYYKLYEYSPSDPADRWSLKWKWDSQFDGVLSRVSVTFNVPVYTHYIEPPK